MSFPLSGYKHEAMWANTGQSQIWESKEQKLLGVIIDRGMKFDEYILIKCKKAVRKLCALGRVSQSAYCPLVWMFCSRSSNNRINHLHEPALTAFPYLLGRLNRGYLMDVLVFYVAHILAR